MPNKTELKKSFRVVNVEGTSAFGNLWSKKHPSTLTLKCSWKIAQNYVTADCYRTSHDNLT